MKNIIKRIQPSITILFFIYLHTNCADNPVFHKPHHYQTYLWGWYNQFQENPSIAQKCFESIIKDDGSIYAYAGYVHHLYNANRYAEITKLMPRIDEALSTHLETQLFFVKALETTGQQSAADKKITELYERFKTNAEISYGATISSIRNNDHAKALTIINEYLDASAERPTHFIFYFLKAQIFFGTQDKEHAHENIQKCLALNPGFDQGWLLSGLIHELEGNIDEAIAGYRNFLQLVGHDQKVEQQLMSLIFKQKHDTQGTSAKKSFETALALYHEKQFTQSLKEINTCLQKDPAYKPARLLKIELLCSLNQTQTGLQLIRSWIDENEHEDTWFRALHLLYQAGIERSAIIALLKTIEQKNPHNSLSILYLADIHLKNHDLDAACTYLHKALPLANDKQISEKILYQLGALYFENHNLEALGHVISIAESGISFAPLLNLCAYYYATHGKNLSKAQECVNKALAGNHNNPHYLDTQALIWYKNHEYEKAYQLLTTLVAQEPNDFFMQKHLSKTEYKRGKKRT